jgi:uncharacterized protein YjaZ
MAKKNKHLHKHLLTSDIKRFNRESISLELKKQKVQINGKNYTLIYHKPLRAKLSLICSTLSKCSKSLLSSMNATIVILPTNDTFVRDKMGGSTGYTPSGHKVIVWIYGLKANKKSIISTVSHEYCHMVRRQDVFWGNTLINGIAFEGLAVNFETKITGKTPPYATALSKKDAKKLWKRIKNRLNRGSGLTYDKLFFGSDDMPRWGGYALSYYLIRNLLLKNKSDFKSLIKIKSKDLVYEALRFW